MMEKAQKNPKRWFQWTPARREAAYGLMFILPWLLSLLVFTAYPVLASIFFSFTDYNVIQPPQWNGVQNYVRMFTNDGSYYIGVKNSAYYAFISVPVSLLFSLIIALFLNVDIRGISIYRTLIYLPSLAPPVASTMVFMLLFNPGGGLVNTILRALGLPTPGWFLDPNWSKPTLIIMSLWGIGSSAIIFLAGLKEVPESLLEAAQIDGAGYWRRLWNVTLPLISPIILFNLIMGVISSFQVFTSGFIIGGTTGQPLESTLFYMTVIYRNAFRYFSMGYASAQSMVLFVAILLVTLVIYVTSGKWVFYEGGGSARK